MSAPKRRNSEKLIPISISTDTLLRILFIGVVAALIYYLWNIVFIFLIAMLLAAIIDPFADRLEAKKIPRGLAVALIYLFIIALAIGVFLLVVPSTVSQSTELIETYGPQIALLGIDENALRFIASDQIFQEDFSVLLTRIKQSGLIDSIPVLLAALSNAFTTLLSIGVVAILSFYMVIEERELKKGVAQWFTPAKYRDLVKTVMPKVRTKLGYWLRGQLTIMLIIFVLSFIILTVLGVPFALVLALLAGLFEIIPFLGPFIAVVPAMIVALSVSPLMAFLVGVFYFLLQQLEADFLTPKIMQKVAGLNPIVSIISILVGWELAGIAGALFAIPIAMVLGLFLSEWFSEKEKV
jgi:predicted PurR-regulated permease PerM